MIIHWKFHWVASNSHNGSYLKCDNGKYYAGYAITTPFDVEAASLLMGILAQHVELYALTWACSSAKDKTANVYIVSRHGFEVVHDFRMWKQHGFLTSSRNKILNGLYVQESLNAMFLSAT